MDIDCIGLYFSVLWKDSVGEKTAQMLLSYISGSLPGWGKWLINEEEQTHEQNNDFEYGGCESGSQSMERHTSIYMHI